MHVTNLDPGAKDKVGCTISCRREARSMVVSSSPPHGPHLPTVAFQLTDQMCGCAGCTNVLRALCRYPMLLQLPRHAVLACSASSMAPCLQAVKWSSCGCCTPRAAATTVFWNLHRRGQHAALWIAAAHSWVFHTLFLWEIRTLYMYTLVTAVIYSN